MSYSNTFTGVHPYDIRRPQIFILDEINKLSPAELDCVCNKTDYRYRKLLKYW